MNQATVKIKHTARPWLASVSAISLFALAGCADVSGDWFDAMLGKKREEQMLPKGRRVPVLNPGGSQAIPPVRESEPPPSPRSSNDETPYDRQQADESTGQVLDRWFSWLEKPSEPSAAAPASSLSEEAAAMRAKRRPLPGPSADQAAKTPEPSKEVMVQEEASASAPPAIPFGKPSEPLREEKLAEAKTKSVPDSEWKPAPIALREPAAEPKKAKAAPVAETQAKAPVEPVQVLASASEPGDAAMPGPVALSPSGADDLESPFPWLGLAKDPAPMAAPAPETAKAEPADKPVLARVRDWLTAERTPESPQAMADLAPAASADDAARLALLEKAPPAPLAPAPETPDLSAAPPAPVVKAAEKQAQPKAKKSVQRARKNKAAKKPQKEMTLAMETPPGKEQADYPALKDVPSNPPALREVQSTHKAQVQNLEAQRQKLIEKKKALDSDTTAGQMIKEYEQQQAPASAPAAAPAAPAEKPQSRREDSFDVARLTAPRPMLPIPPRREAAFAKAVAREEETVAAANPATPAHLAMRLKKHEEIPMAAAELPWRAGKAPVRALATVTPASYTSTGAHFLPESRYAERRRNLAMRHATLEE